MRVRTIIAVITAAAGAAILGWGVLADGQLDAGDVRVLGMAVLVSSLGFLRFERLRRPLIWAFERGVQKALRDVAEQEAAVIRFPPLAPVASDARPQPRSPRR